MPSRHQSSVTLTKVRTRARTHALSDAQRRIQKPSASIAACLGRVFEQTAHGLQVILLAAFTVSATKWEAKRVRTDPEHADPELRRMLSDSTGTLRCL